MAYNLLNQFSGLYIAKEGESCSSACAREKLVCSEEQLFQHKYLFSGCENLKTNIRSLTRNITSCNYSHENEQDVPNLQGTMLNTAHYTRARSTFNCSAKPPLLVNKRRICYCHGTYCFHPYFHMNQSLNIMLLQFSIINDT